jgi:DNA (cytosine-5)-methyltransferase 1
MNKISVASFFSGIGGLDLGFAFADFDLRWSTDFDQLVESSYGYNFKHVFVRSDINDLDTDAIPNTDIIIGGPPCQSFSLVGKREPNDNRGKLVFRYLDIIKLKKPIAFVMENVPGIMSSKVNGVRLVDVLEI